MTYIIATIQLINYNILKELKPTEIPQGEAKKSSPFIISYLPVSPVKIGPPVRDIRRKKQIERQKLKYI